MIATIVHLLLIFGGIFFISPEFSLYSYLNSKGLVPYLNIIDQHFPLIFFGPLNLSQFHLTSPQSTLVLYIALIITTDLLAFRFFQRQLIPTTLFVLCQILLGGNTLWLETFILLFLICYFCLNHASSKLWQTSAGLFLSLSLAVRPTLLPFVLLLIIFNSKQRLLHLFLLPLIPLIQILWLFIHNLWQPFFSMQIFNARYYAQMATQTPSLRQLLIIIWVITPFFYMSHTTKTKLITLSFIASLVILVFPRFELLHLLPLSSLYFFLYSSSHSKTVYLTIWLILTTGYLLFRLIPLQPTNYYYPASLNETASQFQAINTRQPSLYLFGGPDQLYQLTNTTPTGLDQAGAEDLALGDNLFAIVTLVPCQPRLRHPSNRSFAR